MPSLGRFRYRRRPRRAAAAGRRGTLVLLHGFPLNPMHVGAAAVARRERLAHHRAGAPGFRRRRRRSADDVHRRLRGGHHRSPRRAAHRDGRRSAACRWAATSRSRCSATRRDISTRWSWRTRSRRAIRRRRSPDGRACSSSSARKGRRRWRTRCCRSSSATRRGASGPTSIEHVRRQITGNSVESIVGALDALMTQARFDADAGTIHCPVQILVGDEDALDAAAAQRADAPRHRRLRARRHPRRRSHVEHGAASSCSTTRSRDFSTHRV